MRFAFDDHERVVADVLSTSPICPSSLSIRFSMASSFFSRFQKNRSLGLIMVLISLR